MKEELFIQTVDPNDSKEFILVHYQEGNRKVLAHCIGISKANKLFRALKKNWNHLKIEKF